MSGAPGVMPEQLAFRVELVEHRVEVALVDAAAVEQDQRALGLAGRLAVEMDQLDDLARAVVRRAQAVTRGLLIGRRTGSTCSRRCS